jgi:hypothetical protein
LRRRVSDLQLGIPDTIEVLLTYPGGEREEHELHERFKAFRVQGEWFRSDEAILDYLVEKADRPETTSDLSAKGFLTHASSLGINTIGAWQSFWGQHPEVQHLPRDPALFYNKRWAGWIRRKASPKVSYEEAKAIARVHGIKSNIEWQRAWRAQTLGASVPLYPESFYRTKGWEGWRNFLGVVQVKAVRPVRPKREWFTYAECKDWAKAQGIRTITEWRAFKTRDSRVPANPHAFYPEWVDWPSFLGADPDWTAKRPNRRIDAHFSYEECRDHARSLGLRSCKLWRRMFRAKQLHPLAPRHPDLAYKDKWAGWPAFFGTNKYVGAGKRNDLRG